MTRGEELVNDWGPHNCYLESFYGMQFLYRTVHDEIKCASLTEATFLQSLIQ